jgi:DnaJ-class molecular chaperone
VTRPDDAQPAEEVCPPCRGRGVVVSNLGGERSEVTCPWCEGTGRFQRDHDAQAARRAGDVPAPQPDGDA